MINYIILRNQLNKVDKQREQLIRKGREVIRLSKQIIYAVHRDELQKALQLIQQIEKGKKVLDQIVKSNKKMACQGSYKVAIQEYVEAILYYNFVKKGKLVNLKVLPEHFILGLADLTGELVRKAVFLAGKGQVEKVVKIRDEVDHIYGEMLKFDFRDNETRRKVDSIKYDLRKLEDLVLDLKLKRG